MSVLQNKRVRLGIGIAAVALAAAAVGAGTYAAFTDTETGPARVPQLVSVLDTESGG